MFEYAILILLVCGVIGIYAWVTIENNKWCESLPEMQKQYHKIIRDLDNRKTNKTE